MTETANANIVTVEEMFSELKKLGKQEREIQARRDELIDMILNAPKDAWDWISVKYAAAILGRSPSFIYAKINDGKLEALYQGSCVNVRESEIKAINDKYKYRRKMEVKR